ncbi:unnamed protein product [Cuscuta epithymum]|uniref:Uncharacterized protein n=1 Tax=Cuscuta epithymum TaxID=186058 RepID=A0AAV0G713_9ASTE|nr:unnamed protein product [Cuscuta epithymum]
MPRARRQSSIVQWPRPGDEHLPPGGRASKRRPPKAKGLETSIFSPRIPRARRRSSIVQWPRPGDKHPSPGAQSLGTIIPHPKARAQGRSSITWRPKPGDEHLSRRRPRVGRRASPP